MFCHKCGSQIAEGAEFCHKCGTKVILEETAPDTQDISASEEPQMQDEAGSQPEAAAENLINATLVSPGDKKMDVIIALKDSLNISLAEAKDIAETTPMSIKKGISLDEAENIKRIFVKIGATISFTDQNGQPVEVVIHCKECGAELNDGSEFCPSCGKPSAPAVKPEPKYKLPKNLSEFKDFFLAIPVLGKILVILALCLGIFLLICVVILIIGIIKLIFSSAIAFAITVAAAYFIYQHWGAVQVAKSSYSQKGQDLKLPEGMNSNSLLEALNGKFNYPYFKGVRYNESGECVIEGKYSEYPVVFYENGRVKLRYIDKDKKNNLRLILREAIAIQSYINKFFDPSLPYDAINDMKTLKFAEKQIKAIGVVNFLASVIVVGTITLYIINPDTLKPGASVRNAYLSQYSTQVTIEEAFDDFFSNEKWSTYKDESYKYVVFSGVCQYKEEPADIRITFKITGENFVVDSMDINGVEQNDLILYLMLEKIYEVY